MKKIEIISDINQKSQKIKSKISKILEKNTSFTHSLFNND